VRICERRSAFHQQNLREKSSVKNIMIPDRLVSSQELSVEGVLLSSNREITKHQLTLAVFEVVDEDMETFALGTIVLNHDARAADDLAGVTLLVDLAKTSPLAKNLRVTDLNQVDLVFGTEGLNQLDVLGLGTGLDEDTQVSLAFIKGLGSFAQTTSQTIVDESSLQDLLQCYGVVSFVLGSAGCFTRTCRASSTVNFPFGASVAVTSTCSSSGASIGMSSPASDILARDQYDQNQRYPHEISRYALECSFTGGSQVFRYR
jgi:hypothetical protein